MKIPMPAVVLLILLAGCPHIASAQVVIPATPKKFKTRSTGGGGSGGTATPAAPARQPTVVREIQYFTLSDARQWKSTDGRSLLGKLIAFEQSEQTFVDGQPSGPAAQPPARPTLVRDGKARLLVGKTPYEVPLDRLSDEDRDFILALEKAVAASSEAQGK
ncbi:MAG TPA: hypothetical protein DIT64_02040 [Verrucomicrobiales bacterium]|nr:hypothetical protein [Verrucomicrobiales bacterium]